LFIISFLFVSSVPTYDKKKINSFAVKSHTHFSAASSASVHSGHILTCGLVELAPPALAAIEAALKLQKFC
jgi:hypothetical protein